MTTVADVIALMERWYPPHHADEWDRVGLVCGDPSAEVERILLAVDPVASVVAEAVLRQAELVIVHHPLFLRGTSSVAANTPKGRVVHDLIRAGSALFAAHTNADSPAGGVSESLALALGLVDLEPLDPDPDGPMDKLVVFAPDYAAEQIRNVITEAGAGAIGDYDSCTFTATGEGRFRGLEGATPTIGEVGKLEVVDEVRIESVLPRRLRNTVVAAMLSVHPYEEPAYDVFELAALDDPHRGSGRIGRLTQPLRLGAFADRVAGAIPRTAHGVRVAGDPGQLIETVALCGGAGDFLIDRARTAGADAYVTSDLRHHPVSEARENGDMALVDIAHWAAEWTWLPRLAVRLRESLGDTVDVQVSTIATDPWTFRV